MLACSARVTPFCANRWACDLARFGLAVKHVRLFSCLRFFHMLDGELIYRHGSERYTLKGGDLLLFDSSALQGPRF